MTANTEPNLRNAGEFGGFAVEGALVQGSGACGKARRAWALTLSGAAGDEHRYWVCDGDFRRLLEGDLRQSHSGASSFYFEERIVEVPPQVRQAALAAVGAWEGNLPSLEDRCLSRCTAARKIGTDFCTVF